MVRMMDKSDRVKYQAGVRRTLRALEPAAADLFPEDIERIKKRQERAKARAEKDAKAAGKETPAEQERRLAADLNPRSKPSTPRPTLRLSRPRVKPCLPRPAKASR
jgi:hypothetical protein